MDIYFVEASKLLEGHGSCGFEFKKRYVRTLSGPHGLLGQHGSGTRYASPAPQALRNA